MMQLLVDGGTHVVAINYLGETLLQWAASERIEVVRRLLLDREAKFNAKGQ